MHQTSLSILGSIARSARSIGLGPLLGVSRNVMDLAFMKLGRPPLRIKTDGFEICGYLRHRSFLEHLSTGKYEPFTRELFENSLRSGIIVVDGGAHIGLYSLLAAPRIGVNGRVFAFEPDPYNFQALVFNIAKNHCFNVIPIQKALSNAVGIAPFYRSFGTIGSSLINRKDIGKTARISVPVTTLDRELQGMAIDSILIKLDIEGAELWALKGMRNLFQTTDSIIMFVEVNPPALRHGGLDPLDMIGELESFGFRIYFIDEIDRRLVPRRSLIIQKSNLYCIKES